MSDAPRAPSAWQLEHAMSAWQQARAALADDPDLAIDEQVIATLLSDAGVSHPDVLLGRMIDAVIWIDRRAVEADELRKAMTARKSRYDGRGAVVRLMIQDLMGALGKKSHPAKFGTASIAASSRPAVIISDEKALPDEYCKIVRTPNRTLIREDLTVGVVIPGATLSNAAPVLRIAAVKRTEADESTEEIE